MRGALLLGERVQLGSLPSMYAMGQSGPCLLGAAPDGRITIGDDTSINGSTLYAAKEIRIGNRVLIAGDCRIIDNDGHNVDHYPRSFVESPPAHPIVIEDDVWLCADVAVLKGVTIGRGSVIGVGSVVTHDIPPNVLAAGTPARVIRPLKVGEITKD